MAVLAGLAILAGGLLALAFGDNTPTGGSTPSTAAAASQPVAVEPAAPVAPSTGTVGPAATSPSGPQAATGPGPAAMLPPARPASGPGSLEYEVMVESRLTRRLQGAHPLRIDGVDLEILGTQLPKEGRSDEPYLAVRNVRTGEVDYWQSGLRFALRAGVDPETFIRQQTEMRRLFVNPEFAEVAVDAALISGVYARLSADPRVAGVRLLPITTQATPR